MSERGFDATTLRDVSEEAGVSVGLLYRYFPSKRSIIMNLYDELSTELVRRAANMPRGRWTTRFSFALTTSLAVLEPHRAILSALIPVLVGDSDDGLFAPRTAFSRLRVQGVFVDAVAHATDRPGAKVAEALGRLLYLAQLGVILWWLLDRSRNQVATRALAGLIGRILPRASLVLRLPFVRSAVMSGDALLREAIFGETLTPAEVPQAHLH